MRPKSTWSSSLDAWCVGSNVSRPGLPLSLLSGLGHELLRVQRSAGSSHQTGRRMGLDGGAAKGVASSETEGGVRCGKLGEWAGFEGWLYVGAVARSEVRGRIETL
ncbi:hypothetical protein V6N12_039038 [Hibiscus sabdariffa]|uniref:Uncharacterized protein n=1 Tax=Hibiscus sabdariffa TaxID=183260 RepID=A0ABR2DZG8_9ROSI